MLNDEKLAGSAEHSLGGEIRGALRPRWQPLVDALQANLTTGDEDGFQVSIAQHGHVVVDLQGGWVDRAHSVPYPAQALQMGFSVAKGALGLCVGLLIERSQLDVNRTVASYWPEFGAAGKSAITVRQLLNHSAGLPAFERTMSVEDLADWSLCVSELAAQSPVWNPGEAHGYHALTSGYLVGELISRASGQSHAAFFRDEIAAPLGASSWFGVPTDRLRDVIPHIEGPEGVDFDSGAPKGEYAQAAIDNPPVSLAALDGPRVWMSDVPAVSLITDASGIARCYSIAVPGDSRLISARTLETLLSQGVWGDDQILKDQPTRFGGFFMLASPREPMLSTRSFGHNGYTGSLAFADPDTAISFAYLGVRSERRSTPHARITRILAGIRACL